MAAEEDDATSYKSGTHQLIVPNEEHQSNEANYSSEYTHRNYCVAVDVRERLLHCDGEAIGKVCVELMDKPRRHQSAKRRTPLFLCGCNTADDTAVANERPDASCAIEIRCNTAMGAPEENSTGLVTTDWFVTLERFAVASVGKNVCAKFGSDGERTAIEAHQARALRKDRGTKSRSLRTGMDICVGDMGNTSG